jgi:hypothetical protein
MNRRRIILLIVAAALMVAVLIPVVRHCQLRFATEAYIAQLKAQGEPMDLAQVAPSPLPPEQNSADTFRQAAVLLDVYQNWEIRPKLEANKREQSTQGDSTETYDVGGMRMVAPGKAMILWQQPDIREGNSTFEWPDIEAVLAKNENTFALLQQIVGKPDFDFQIEYGRGFDDFSITNLYLAETKRAAQRLSTAALCDLHYGDTASAVENIRAMLAITQGLRDERFVISELVRFAIAQITVDATWDLLQSPNLTDAQLAQLQQDWTELDFVQSEEDALVMERGMRRITVAEWRRSGSQLEHDYRFGNELNGGEVTLWDEARMAGGIFMWRHWWSYPDEMRALKSDEVLIKSMRLVETNGSFQDWSQYQNEALKKMGIRKSKNEGLKPDNTDFHSILSQEIDVFNALTRRVMTAQVAKEMATTAIALKRYQLKYGNYPTDLKAMVPEFLPAVPLDPVDGQPLRYHPKANGTFLLYSVGENGKDDGGSPLLEQGIEGANLYWLNQKALDWVWPQPATAKEIQDYYAHPPK